MPSASVLRKYIPFTCVGLLLAGCVYTGSEFKPQSAGISHVTQHSKIPGNIVITEGTALNQSYCVIGEVNAYAHKFTSLAPVPTREDVDQELRAKAAEAGADAVVGVQYATEGTFFPPSDSGQMKATGKAVVVIAKNGQCSR